MAAKTTREAGFRTVPVAEVHPYPGNPRKITDAGLRKIGESLSTFGFVAPIIAQLSTGIIVAGHQRFRAATEILNMTEVPVVFLDLTDDQAKAYNVADNRTGEEADWDRGKLSELLLELEAADGLIGSVGLSDDEVRELIALSSVEFPEYDEKVEFAVPTITCPNCGHVFPS